jgi:NAD(P)-dependent dehydrogenase (short-subunit alcohol dehydrogenase family)
VADLAGRTVVIAGVGPGLGRETALVAAREGGNVVLGARTESVLESVAKEVEAAGGQAAYQRLDISKPADCQAIIDLALERFGQLDGLISVAAFDSLFGGLEAADADFADWKSMFDVNVFGTLTLIRCALPALEQSNGSVVLVSSQTQHHPPPLALQMAYASSKSALTGAMRDRGGGVRDPGEHRRAGLDVGTAGRGLRPDARVGRRHHPGGAARHHDGPHAAAPDGDRRRSGRVSRVFRLAA